MLSSNRLALALLIALGLAGRASAEACTCGGAVGGTEAFNWGPIGTDGSGWDVGTVGACTPSGDDTFTVGANCTVTVINNAVAPTEDVVLTTGGITVASGGRLVVQRNASAPTASIDGGNGGLTVQDGGEIVFAGSCKKGPRNATAVTTSMSDADCTESHAWFVGDVVPCDNDCATTPHELRIVWPESKYGGQGASANPGWASTGLDEAVRSLNDNQDVICFLNFWPTSTRQSGELLQCFEVLEHMTTAPGAGNQDYYVVIDLRQGSETNDLNPITRRNLVETTIDAAVAKADRDLSFPTGAIPNPIDSNAAFDFDYDGAWVRFDDSGLTPCTLGSNCVPSPLVYRLQDVADGGGGSDTGKLLDLRGVAKDYPSGTRVWLGLSQGIEAGDRFFVLDPVRYHTNSGTEGHGTNNVTLDLSDADNSVKYALFDRIGAQRYSGCPGAAVPIQSVWWRDNQSNGSSNDLLTEINTGTNESCFIDHMLVTGVDSDQASDGTSGCSPTARICNTEHGLSLSSDVEGTVQTHRIRDLAIRYNNDDSLTAAGTASAYTVNVNFEGLTRFEYLGDYVDSGELADCAAKNNGVFNFQNLMAVGGYYHEDSNADNSQGPVFSREHFQGGCSGVITGSFVDFGGFGSLTKTGTVLPSSIKNLLAANLTNDDTTDMIGNAGLTIDGFSLRELKFTSASAGSSTGNMIEGSGSVFKNGWIGAGTTWVDVDPFAIRLSASTLSNVLIENFPGSGASNLVNITASGGVGNNTVENLSIVYNGVASTSSIALGGWGGGSGNAFRNFLGYGFAGASGWFNGLDDTVNAISGTFCTTHAAGPTAQYTEITQDGGTVVLGYEPGFVRNIAGEHGLAKASFASTLGCGARGGAQAPGIKTIPLGLAVNKLGPECASEECGRGTSGGGRKLRMY